MTIPAATRPCPCGSEIAYSEFFAAVTARDPSLLPSCAVPLVQYYWETLDLLYDAQTQIAAHGYTKSSRSALRRLSSQAGTLGRCLITLAHEHDTAQVDADNAGWDGNAVHECREQPAKTIDSDIFTVSGVCPHATALSEALQERDQARNQRDILARHNLSLAQCVSDVDAADEADGYVPASVLHGPPAGIVRHLIRQLDEVRRNLADERVAHRQDKAAITAAVEHARGYLSDTILNQPIDTIVAHLVIQLDEDVALPRRPGH